MLAALPNNAKVGVQCDQTGPQRDDQTGRPTFRASWSPGTFLRPIQETLQRPLRVVPT